MPDQPRRSKMKLIYDDRLLDPTRLMTFVEMGGFTDDWQDARLTDDDLQALQIVIMAHPTIAPVVAGTGRLRKLRFAPPSRHQGKRGALRICYVYFEEFGVVLLVIMYDKTKKDNLTPDEKKTIKQLISEVHQYLSKRHYRLHTAERKGSKP